ncbi:MAG: Uma2 family endonuclease [Saprospiraceae bacterium]|nr:Uma2 family endonuclease [Saprospiraceae bacterium]
MLIAEKKITVQEYRQMEFEGEDAYYELINGQIVKKAAPTPLHQEISQNLNNLMDNFVRKHQLGKVFTAPIDVFLDDYNHLMPDILFIKTENLKIVDYREGILGVPDLVVEIISRSSILIDREDKKRVYESAGVEEYWLIDPNYRSIEVYKNKNGRFEVVSFAIEDGKAQSLLLSGFEVDIKELFPLAA